MAEAVEARIGKKYAVYIPAAIARRLGLKEGDRIVVILQGDRIVIRRRVGVYEAAARTEKRLRLSPEEAEEASLEEQERLLGGSHVHARGKERVTA